MGTSLPAALQNSHRNGGPVFLIFVADPRTVRSCSSAARAGGTSQHASYDAWSSAALIPTDEWVLPLTRQRNRHTAHHRIATSNTIGHSTAPARATTPWPVTLRGDSLYEAGSSRMNTRPHSVRGSRCVAPRESFAMRRCDPYLTDGARWRGAGGLGTPRRRRAWAGARTQTDFPAATVSAFQRRC